MTAGEAEVLRIAVQGGGCSGFQYALGFDRGPQEGDHELSSQGVPVVVDPFSVAVPVTTPPIGSVGAHVRAMST